MENGEIYQKLDAIFHDVFCDDHLVTRPDLAPEEIEAWDSLGHIRLILSVENVFHIKFSAAHIGGLKNVGDLVQLIRSKL